MKNALCILLFAAFLAVSSPIFAEQGDVTLNVDELIDNLSDRYLDARERAFEQLKEGGPGVGAALLAAGPEANPQAQLLIVRLLGVLRVTESREFLLDVLESDQDEELRNAAIVSVLSLGPGVIDELTADKDRPIVRYVMETVRTAVTQLGHPSSSIRTRAENLVLNAGTVGEDLLLETYEQLVNDEQRLAVVNMFGKLKCERAVPKLALRLKDATESEVDSIASALESIGDAAVSHLQSLTPEAGSEYEARIQRVLTRELQRIVEEFIATQITERGGWGFYTDQFKPLAKYGKANVAPILLRLFLANSPNIYVTETLRNSTGGVAAVRALSATALGEVGDESVVAELEEIAGRENQTNDTENAAFALWKMGHRKHYDNFTNRLRETLDKLNPVTNFNEYLGVGADLAIIYIRRDEYDKSETLYLKLIETNEKLERRGQAFAGRQPLLYYNLACVYSLKGDVEKGVKSLREAIEAGYQDLRWIQLDRDLDNLRNHPGYKKLLLDTARELGVRLDDLGAETDERIDPSRGLSD